MHGTLVVFEECFTVDDLSTITFKRVALLYGHSSLRDDDQGISSSTPCLSVSTSDIHTFCFPLDRTQTFVPLHEPLDKRSRRGCPTKRVGVGAIRKK